MRNEVVEQIEQLIRRDPANRGLIATEKIHGPLCPGHLGAAAAHLAEHATHVGIVTGFYVPRANPPAGETDGPPGTMMLALALQSLDVDVTVLTDELCRPAVAAAAEAVGLDAGNLAIYPHRGADWAEQFFSEGSGSRLSHLISIERPGPSHTLDSLLRQRRATPAPVNDFLALVPVESYDRCHNMLGNPIDEQTADMYQLFDALPRFRPDAKSIGVGDGGNEIGMGSIPWEELDRRLEGEQSVRIPCRVATDWTIVAGVSNWGGYALAAAVLVARGDVSLLRDWDADRERDVIRQMVERGGAVDGVTARREATVDGLPFMTYIQPWVGIRRLLGFE